MGRGHGWWGTAPLVAGLGGLLLLAFGARGMQDRDPAKEFAQQMADALRKELEVAENAQTAREYLVEAQNSVKYETRGKSVDLESLAPKKGEDVDAKAIADQAYDRIYAKLSEQHDPGLTVVERIAFYGGLILVFAAGILLYRRTPDSVRGTW